MAMQAQSIEVSEVVVGKTKPWGLAVFLLASPVGAGLILLADQRGIIDLWSWMMIGPELLCGIIVLCAYALTGKEKPQQVLLVCMCFCFPLFMDLGFVLPGMIAHVLSLDYSHWSEIALVMSLFSTLIGSSYVYRMKNSVVKGGFCIIGACIQAVYIYDGYHMYRHMSFFGGSEQV